NRRKLPQHLRSRTLSAWLHCSDYHVLTALAATATLVQHAVGLAHAGAITQEDLEKPPWPRLGFESAMHSELDQKRQIKPVLELPQVWCKPGDHRAGSAAIAARGRHPARSGEVGNVRLAMVELPAEGDVLLGHVVQGGGGIPGLERITRGLWEVRRA